MLSIYIAYEKYWSLSIMMPFEEFAADLPRRHSQLFTSPAALEEAMKQAGVYQPTRQTKSGKFHAGLAHRKSALCDLFSDRYSSSLSLYLESPQGEVGILLPRSPSCHFIINGVNLGDDHLAIATKGEGMDIAGPGPIGSDCISMSRPRFSEMLAVLCPTASVPEGLTLVKGFPPELSALGDLIVNLIGKPDAEFNGEQITNLLAWTVSVIGHASEQYRPESIKGLKTHSQIAKDAQEYIEAKFRHSVSIEDLCRYTGVGIRMLQRCFREYFDLTITDYLTTVRLDSAYRELASTESGKVAVTKIALDNGFTHLGRFSVGYRLRFGESPSDTLKAPLQSSLSFCSIR